MRGVIRWLLGGRQGQPKPGPGQVPPAGPAVPALSGLLAQRAGRGPGPAVPAPTPTPIRVGPVARPWARPAGPADLPPVPGDRPWRFVALDVETANADPGSLCQIGLACVASDGAITPWGTLVDPAQRFEAFNITLHGISPARVAGAPVIARVMAALGPFLAGRTVVQHSGFDRRAIETACRTHGLPPPACTWVDSVRIARQAWPELTGDGGHGLASLKRHLDLRFDHHDAVEDARAAALVVLRAEAVTGRPFDAAPEPRAKRATPTAAPATDCVVFTGALSMTREMAAGLATRRGMVVQVNVTARTTLLVVGDQDVSRLAGADKSSRHRRAEERIAGGQQIRIMAEAEFRALVGG